MSTPADKPTTAEPVSAEDMFYAGLYWVWDVPGLGLRAAEPGECAAEIKRLHTVIRAAREELEDGGGGEAEAHLILKHSGVSCMSDPTSTPTTEPNPPNPWMPLWSIFWLNLICGFLIGFGVRGLLQ